MPVTSGHRAVILIAEDDPGDLELTRREFARAKIGNSLLTVEDGEGVIDLLRRRNRFAAPSPSPSVDILLLDLTLPRIPAWDVISEIRGDSSLSHLPILVMAVSDQAPEIPRAYQVGANAHLLKPVAIQQFFAAMALLPGYWVEAVVPSAPST